MGTTKKTTIDGEKPKPYVFREGSYAAKAIELMNQEAKEPRKPIIIYVAPSNVKTAKKLFGVDDEE